MMQLNERMTNTEVMKEHLELMNMEWTDLDDFERKWGSGATLRQLPSDLTCSGGSTS